MSKVLDMRRKRGETWDKAKAFLDSCKDENGLLSAEDTATYERMEQEVVDLGHAPPSNAYLTEEALHRPEITYPLRVYVCGSCRLVQTEDYAQPEDLFASDYAYFSSTSKSWP